MDPSTAAYPVTIRSQTGEMIARINPDRTWSVKWNAVTDQAYAAMTDDNIAIGSICKLLVAGRDNFRTSRWDDVQPWPYVQFDIACSISGTGAAFVLMGLGDVLVAYVNSDGIWSVDWKQVYIMRALPHDYWGFVPMAGFCELLWGARDNFRTAPMKLRLEVEDEN